MDLSAALDAVPASERPRFDRDTERLVGSQCLACGARSWPSRSVCHICGSADLEVRSFSRDGVLVSYTTCWVPRPGLEPPFTLGQVRLEDGVKIFSHIRSDGEREIEVGASVRTVVAGSGSLPEFWFEIVKEEAKA